MSTDGRDIEAVAQEAGVETIEKTLFPDEIAGATRSLLFSASPGAVLAAEAVESGFILRSLKRRVNPDLADRAVAARMRERLIAERLDTLVVEHITWSFDPWTVP